MPMPVSSRVPAPRRSRSAANVESTTTRLTPVWRAPATIARVESAITDPLPPSVLMTASAPSSARVTADASVTSPLTTRRFEWSVVSFSGERTSAVTEWPAASPCSTTRRPVRPVAPRTTRFISIRSCLQISKLKLQVVTLQALEASTYSGTRSGQPVSRAAPIAEPS